MKVFNVNLQFVMVCNGDDPTSKELNSAIKDFIGNSFDSGSGLKLTEIKNTTDIPSGWESGVPYGKNTNADITKTIVLENKKRGKK